MTTEIKNCPFCSGAGALEHDKGCDKFGPGGWVTTPQSWRCGCNACRVWHVRHGSAAWSKVPELDEIARAGALSAWNQRLGDPPANTIGTKP
ncbi:MAG: Restriction alleviation protein Lar [Pseudomonadota bacterium]|jgi:hypothetical protein